MTRFSAPAIAVMLMTTLCGASTTAPDAVAATAIEEGRKIALDRRKGNCAACHVIEDAPLPGNVGPPLFAMKARFPDRARLRDQIRDATKTNPKSLMPPFGRHEILTEDEIDKVVEFIHSL